MNTTTSAFAYIVIHHLYNRRKRRRIIQDESMSVLKSGNSNQLSVPKIPRSLFSFHHDLLTVFPQIALSDFEYLLSLVEPIIQDQKSSDVQRCITPKEKLMIVLKYLVTGRSLTEVSHSYNISIQSVYELITDVCDAIIESLKSYMNVPYSEEEWLTVSKEYEKKWNFPHCLGSIDGRHVLLQVARMNAIFTTRPNAVALIAIVDANYNFLYVNVNYKGHLPCTNVFQKSGLYEELKIGTFKIPSPEVLVKPSHTKVPYMFITNNACNLSKYTIKPYESLAGETKLKNIFNYRLSRAGHTAQNAFGVLASVFKILRRPIELNSERVKKIILATVSLHNYLRKREDSINLYSPPNMFDTEVNGEIVNGSWRTNDKMTSFLPLQSIPHRAAINAERVRLHLANYFIKKGAIQSQNDYLKKNMLQTL